VSCKSQGHTGRFAGSTQPQRTCSMSITPLSSEWAALKLLERALGPEAAPSSITRLAAMMTTRTHSRSRRRWPRASRYARGYTSDCHPAGPSSVPVSPRCDGWEAPGHRQWHSQHVTVEWLVSPSPTMKDGDWEGCANGDLPCPPAGERVGHVGVPPPRVPQLPSSR